MTDREWDPELERARQAILELLRREAEEEQESRDRAEAEPPADAEGQTTG